DDTVVTLQNKSEKPTVIDITSLTLTPKGKHTAISLLAYSNGMPISLGITTDLEHFMNPDKFSFSLAGMVSDTKITASGNVSLLSKNAKITDYSVENSLMPENTKIGGHADINWGSAVPSLTGSIEGKTVNLANLLSGLNSKAAANNNAPAAQAPLANDKNYMFSGEPLPFDALKQINFDIDIIIDELQIAKGAIKNLQMNGHLKNQVLNIVSKKAEIDAKPVSFKILVNAANYPAHVSALFSANDVAVGSVLNLMNMNAFISGTGTAEANIMSYGNTMHQLASNLDGTLLITAINGEIFTGRLGQVSSALTSFLTSAKSKSETNALNCMAARFIAKNGIVTDNGILLDSAGLTVFGKGNANLLTESLAFRFLARTKLAAVVESITPALEVTGSLKEPNYSLNASQLVASVVDGVINGQLPTQAGVPNMLTPPREANEPNACVYTLDNIGRAMPLAKDTDSPIENVKQTIKDTGSKLLKGLFKK
ncbi:MAG: AsmA-like C-terminal region-containing protein, partial [Alphaproteobacteria bacterium]|nr:AsmA-like C-terminal region-containing protein [Alphaproteobacteria bacterium]